MTEPRKSVLKLIGQLALLLLIGCGGGGSNSTSQQNHSGLPDATHTKADLFVVTDDPAMPYLYFDNGGVSIGALQDPTSGEDTGFIVTTTNGQTVRVDLDPNSGLPTQMIAGDAVFVFGNIRQDSGLADVAYVDAAGDTTLFRDVTYAAFAAGNGATTSNIETDSSPPQSSGTEIAQQPLVIHHESVPIALADSVQSRSHGNTFNNLNGKQLEERYERSVTAWGLGWDIASCTTGSIMTLASTVGVAIDPVKVFGVGLFELSATSTIAVCGKAAHSIFREKYPADAVVVGVSDAQNTFDDISGFGSALAATYAPCVNEKSRTLKECLKAGYDLAKARSNGTFAAVHASALRARDHVARLYAFSVYCCNGPELVVASDTSMKSWTVVVVDGIGETPYQYEMNWGDQPDIGNSAGTPVRTDILVSNSFRQSFRKNYPFPGQYKLTPKVTDSASPKNTGFLLAPKTVIVVPRPAPLTIECCTGASVSKINKPSSVTAKISGGQGPYVLEVDWDDGKSNNYLMSQSLDEAVVSHAWESAGEFDVVLTATDSVGETAKSTPVRIEVVAAPSVQCCTGPATIMAGTEASWNFTIQDGVPPYSYTVEWGDSSNSSGTDEKTVSRPHTYRAARTESILVSVTDSDGDMATSDAFTVVVTGDSEPDNTAPPGPGTTPPASTGYVLDRIDIPEASYMTGGSVECTTTITDGKRTYNCKTPKEAPGLNTLDLEIVHDFRIREDSDGIYTPGEKIYIDIDAKISGYSYCCSVGNYIVAEFEPGQRFTIDTRSGDGVGHAIRNGDLPATGVAGVFNTERQGEASNKVSLVATVPALGEDPLKIVLTGTNGSKVLSYHLRKN